MGILQAQAELQSPTPLTIYFHDENPLPPIGKIAETGIRSKLSDSGLYLYDKMDREGKTLVYQLMQQDCKHQNGCKGLNSCALKGNNQCAGQSECKGKSNGLFNDPNLAVKVASKKLYSKRLETQKEISLK